MAEAQALEGIGLFEHLTEEERAAVARLARVRALKPQEAVVWVGDTSREFFVILSGSAEVVVPHETGKELRVAVLKAGSYFGELSMFDGGPRTTTVRAIEPLSVLEFGPEDFEGCMRRHPALALDFIHVLAQRQRSLLDKLRGIRNLNEVIEQKLTAWQRVANFIAETAASRGFLLTHAFAFSGWIASNALLGPRAWDPYPFLFLCFWASVEAIFLSLFILVSQATQSQRDRLRNEQDYQVAVKLQFEIMQLHQKLDGIAAPAPAAEAGGRTDPR